MNITNLVKNKLKSRHFKSGCRVSGEFIVKS